MAMHVPSVDNVLPHALALMQANRLAEAETTLAAACRTQKASGEHWFLLGAVVHMQGRANDALTALERALALQPHHANALNARASILASLGRAREAMTDLHQVLRLRPRNVDACVNLGLLLEQAGDATGALTHYTTALDADPRCRAARLNRSALHLAQQRFDSALQDCDALLVDAPGDTAARCNRAKALLGLDRYDDVIMQCDALLAADPGSLGALTDRGIAHACRGDFDAARADLEAARVRDPAAFVTWQRQAWASAGTELRHGWTHAAGDLPDPRAIFLSRGADRLARCDWRGRDAFLSSFESVVRKGVAEGDPVCDWSLPFAAMWLPVADDVRRALADAVCRRVEAGIPKPSTPAACAPSVLGRRGPLRIGYISPKFRDHPGATLCPPILEQHDRARVLVYGYALNPRDPGPLAERFRRSCDRMRECWGRNDGDVARQIRDDGIQVLVDVGGYTDYARPEIFAHRPAPIQAAYVGFMTSLQASWMDYIITDAVATPASQAAQWREHIVHLPRTLLCYDPPPARLPAPPSRAQCGLPDDGFVFCCFNHPYKIEPRAFRIWMRLLQRTPGSVLWLLRHQDSDVRLRAAARGHGIDPARLVFADRVERSIHLARQQQADLFLDTFDYNAHTTAAEAYYAGLPVLTLPGSTTVARCGASIAFGAGVPEMIARGEHDYEERALHLAHSPHAMAALKARLAQHRMGMPLFDAASLARAFEAAFERMWERHAAGHLPASFAVAPTTMPAPEHAAHVAPFLTDEFDCR